MPRLVDARLPHPPTPALARIPIQPSSSTNAFPLNARSYRYTLTPPSDKIEPESVGTTNDELRRRVVKEIRRAGPRCGETPHRVFRRRAKRDPERGVPSRLELRPNGRDRAAAPAAVCGVLRARLEAKHDVSRSGGGYGVLRIFP